MARHYIESRPFGAPYVRIRGRISRGGEVQFSPCVRTFHAGRSGSQPSAEPEDKIEHPSPRLQYRVAIEDGKDRALESGYFPAKFGAVTREWTRFVVRLPYRATAKRITVYRENSRLGALSFPSHAPEFTLLHPTTARSIDPSNCLELDWRPEGRSATEELTYFVRYSPDGKRWCRPAVNLTGLRCCVDLRLMEGGERCRVQVLATNGYHTSYVETPTFAMPEKPIRILTGRHARPNAVRARFLT